MIVSGLGLYRGRSFWSIACRRSLFNCMVRESSTDFLTTVETTSILPTGYESTMNNNLSLPWPLNKDCYNNETYYALVHNQELWLLLNHDLFQGTFSNSASSKAPLPSRPRWWKAGFLYGSIIPIHYQIQSTTKLACSSYLQHTVGCKSSVNDSGGLPG